MPASGGAAPVILAFSSAEAWESWLARNHAGSNGLWMRIFKKASDEPSVTYDEALDVALCYGWIDGQGKGYDHASSLQRFTPRRLKSLWSKRNREHVARLTAAGRMKPAGLAAVAEAKRDGRWERAYDSPSTMAMPEDLLRRWRRTRRQRRSSRPSTSATRIPSGFGFKPRRRRPPAPSASRR